MNQLIQKEVLKHREIFCLFKNVGVLLVPAPRLFVNKTHSPRKKRKKKNKEYLLKAYK